MAFTYGYAVGPKSAGVNLALIHSTAQHRMGTKVFDNLGRVWLYVKANGSIALGNFIKAALADDPYTNVVISTASGATGEAIVIGMAPVALVAGNFAWIVNQGVFEDDAQIVSAAVAAGDALESDANGDGDIALAASIDNAIATCLVDDGDNTGTVLLHCKG